MKKRRAFTVVELMVVSGIVVTLSAMLMPALNRARAHSKSIQCQSNLRQIGTLFAMYQTSNNGYYPCGTYYYSWSFDDNWTWDEQLQEIKGNVRTVSETAPTGPAPATGGPPPGYSRWILGDAFWRCPGSTNYQMYPWDPVEPENRTYRGYGYNLALINWWYTFGGRGYQHPVKIPPRYKIVVIGDRNWACYFGVMAGMDLGGPANTLPDTNFESPYQTSFRHARRINYLFSDFSVASLKLSEAVDPSIWNWPHTVPN